MSVIPPNFFNEEENNDEASDDNEGGNPPTQESGRSRGDLIQDIQMQMNLANRVSPVKKRFKPIPAIIVW